MKKKLKKYKIWYFFDGRGVCEVEAENQNEAEENFFEGNWTKDQDKSENYCITSIEAIK